MKIKVFCLINLILVVLWHQCSLGQGTQKKLFKPALGKNLVVFTTAQGNNSRLTLTDTLLFKKKGQPGEAEISVFVDPQKTFQTFLGIGGALTDASAETFYKLSKKKQKEFLIAYFDKKDGIGYTLGRTNINSCDFSSDNYTYVKDGDVNLSTFNIDHDRKFKIPFIKEVTKAAGGKLNLFVSPWSPPAWMKDNQDMLHGGKLKLEFYPNWALYFTKFIKAYEKEGIPIWGLSVQNEPMAKQIWESCNYTAEEERDFLKNNLGPTLYHEGLKDKKVIVWDHNRDLIYQRAQTYFNDPEASKYIWGIGFHWYETWSGGSPMYENVKKVSESFPGKNLLFTEGCAESFDSTRFYSWDLGEKYGKSMITDFNNGMVGFTDWNILLDEKGGPNHVGNFCFAPIHANIKTGELIFTNAYYYIGHFSKFILPGAKRIISSSSRSALLSTAFKNENGKVVIIVMNQSDKALKYNLYVSGDAVLVASPAHSIQTLLL